MFERINSELINHTVKRCERGYNEALGVVYMTVTLTSGKKITETAEYEELLTCSPFSFGAKEAEWIAEYLPESIGLAFEVWEKRGRCWLTFDILDEGEFFEFLEWRNVTEEEYCEGMGHIFRDVSLSGTLVIGE